MMISILEIQLQTVFYPGYSRQNINQFKHLSSEKRIYQWTSLIIMYYITSLAKFGNCYTTVWARRQDQWEGNNYSLSFQRMRKKFTHCFYNVFTDVIFYPHILQYFQVSKTIPALYRMSCYSDYLAHCYCTQTFEVCGPKLYQSENEFLPLLLSQFHSEQQPAL